MVPPPRVPRLWAKSVRVRPSSGQIQSKAVDLWSTRAQCVEVDPRCAHTVSPSSPASGPPSPDSCPITLAKLGRNRPNYVPEIGRQQPKCGQRVSAPGPSESARQWLMCGPGLARFRPVPVPNLGKTVARHRPDSTVAAQVRPIPAGVRSILCGSDRIWFGWGKVGLRSVGMTRNGHACPRPSRAAQPFARSTPTSHATSPSPQGCGGAPFAGSEKGRLQGNDWHKCSANLARNAELK